LNLSIKRIQFVGEPTRASSGWRAKARERRSPDP
jgi:hypothetical protein